MKHFLLIILLINVLPTVPKAQNFPDPKTDSIITLIAQNNTYETSATVGFRGATSSQQKHLEELGAIAAKTPAAILALMASEKQPAIIRLYAYLALRKSNIPIPLPLFSLIQNDMRPVIVANGCMRYSRSIQAIVCSNSDNFVAR